MTGKIMYIDGSNRIHYKGSVLDAQTEPPNFVLYNEEATPILTIHPDGTITFGSAFTTEDEASLHFWKAVRAMGFQLTHR